MDKVITDYLKPKYPNMPDLLIERARNSLNSESVLSSVAQDFGLAHAVVDERTLQLSQQIVFSIIGAVEEQLNSDQAIRLIKHHFLTRQIDWTNLIDFDYPEKVLEEITGEYYNTRPVTR